MWFKRKVINKDIDQELTELRAKLAKYELLPDGDFTIYRSPYQGGIIHGVDRKPNEILRLRAQIAYYEAIKSNQVVGFQHCIEAPSENKTAKPRTSTSITQERNHSA